MLTAIFLLLILSKVVTYVWAFQLHVAQILNAFYESHLHSHNCGLPGRSPLKISNPRVSSLCHKNLLQAEYSWKVLLFPHQYYAEAVY